jgi:carbon starvation protein CstA
MTFFGGTGGLQAALAAGGPAGVVNEMSSTMLGTVGGILALLAVIILPITTGDTALRSSRMIVMESVSKWFDPGKKRTVIMATVVLGVPAFLLSTIDYSFLWRYVGGTNQLSATIMLWVVVSYLLKEGRAHAHILAGIPALFMTGVVATYFLYAPEGLNLDYTLSLTIGGIITFIVFLMYIRQIVRHREIAVKNVLIEPGN